MLGYEIEFDYLCAYKLFNLGTKCELFELQWISHKSVNQLPSIWLVIVNSFDRSRDQKISFMTTKQMTLYSNLKWKWHIRFMNQALPFLNVCPSFNHIIYFIQKISIQCWNPLTMSFQGFLSMIWNCHK
jgi:hypothetical protein